MKKPRVEITGLQNTAQRRRVRRAVAAAMSVIPKSHSQYGVANSKSWLVSIAFISSTRMKTINKNHRRKNKPTDVLSFPMWQGEWVDMPGPALLGEIYICAAVAKAQCEEWGNTFAQELERLTVHGTLHLLDYDHERSAREAKVMSALEERAIQLLR